MKNQIVGNDKIFIGRRTDNNVREFAIDISELTECMDEGYTIAMYAVLPQQSDELAYPISSDNFRIEGNTLYWIPTDADTSVEGAGKLQICLYNDTQLVNSLIFKTVIERTLAQGAEPPEAYEPFLLEVERLHDDMLNYNLVSEGYAVGTQDGEPVTEGTYFENNAKFYAEKAEQHAADNGWLHMDIVGGHLIMSKTPSVDMTFYIENGNLMMERTIA